MPWPREPLCRRCLSGFRTQRCRILCRSCALAGRAPHHKKKCSLTARVLWPSSLVLPDTPFPAGAGHCQQCEAQWAGCKAPAISQSQESGLHIFLPSISCPMRVKSFAFFPLLN